MACNITDSPAADKYEDSDGNDEDHPCGSWTNDERQSLLDIGVIFFYMAKQKPRRE